jgi:hypothetical protein
LGIAVSCILSMWPSHCIHWLLINLTIFSPLIMSSNSSFLLILHNSFSFTGPYIFRRIFLSNTASRRNTHKIYQLFYIQYLLMMINNCSKHVETESK